MVVSLEKVPGSVDNPTLNCFALEIPLTTKFLLKPSFCVAAVLLVLFTLKSSIPDPTLKL